MDCAPMGTVFPKLLPVYKLDRYDGEIRHARCAYPLGTVLVAMMVFVAMMAVRRQGCNRDITDNSAELGDSEPNVPNAPDT